MVSNMECLQVMYYFIKLMSMFQHLPFHSLFRIHQEGMQKQLLLQILVLLAGQLLLPLCQIKSPTLILLFPSNTLTSTQSIVKNTTYLVWFADYVSNFVNLFGLAVCPKVKLKLDFPSCKIILNEFNLYVSEYLSLTRLFLLFIFLR